MFLYAEIDNKESSFLYIQVQYFTLVYIFSLSSSLSLCYDLQKKKKKKKVVRSINKWNLF
jgi:hypothetical protein